jgi:uncharacterized membrane protein (DUF2068 family)
MSSSSWSSYLSTACGVLPFHVSDVFKVLAVIRQYTFIIEISVL